MPHKAGFVNIIGNPNAGKSTLMNRLVGEKLSIITPKAQTTRHRILGIVNGDDYQMVFSDTPGIIKPAYELHQMMMKQVGTAIEDADIILLIVELYARDTDAQTLEQLAKTETPVIVVINKVDLLKEGDPSTEVQYWVKLLPKAEVIAVSALRGFNTENLFTHILKILPEHEGYYPKDDLTDKSERFFISEIIREKIFLNYDREVPYCCEVTVEDFQESDTLIKIRAIIHVARDSQKGILIGHLGSAMKKTGTQARIDMEAWLGKKVFLDLQVKVSKDWRNNSNQLTRFGYNQ
ncbi:MAG: GTPase Era [Bacteroidota bacterium]